MPGSLLRDDWQTAVEDELKQHAANLTRQFQVVQEAPRPDPTQVFQQLQQTAQQALQFGQQQVAQPVQQAQQGIVQFGQQAQQSAADVQQQLQAAATQVFAAQPQQSTPEPQALGVAPLVPPSPAAAGDMPNVQVDPSSPEAFVRSITPAAKWVEARTGLPAESMIAMAANETGYGKFAAGNNLFGIKGTGPAGSTNAGTWEDYGQGPVQIRDNFRAYQSAAQSFMDFADLIQNAPRYAKALGQSTVEGFVGALRQGGYMTDPNYVGKIRAIADRWAPVIGGTPPALPHAEEPGSSTDSLGDKWKTQFGFKATYTGDYRTGTPHRGIDVVPQRGGIGTPVEAFVPGEVTLIQRDSGGAGGLMVYVRDRDGLTHAYMHLANAAPGLKVGQLVNRGDVIAAMGESGTEGSPHLHYEVRRGLNGDPLDQLIDPRPYMAGQGTASQPARVGPSPTLNVGGERPAAKEPIYTTAAVQPTQAEQTPFQIVGDVAGQAGSLAGGVFSDIGRGAQQTAQDVGQFGQAAATQISAGTLTPEAKIIAGQLSRAVPGLSALTPEQVGQVAEVALQLARGPALIPDAELIQRAKPYEIDAARRVLEQSEQAYADRNRTTPQPVTNEDIAGYLRNVQTGIAGAIDTSPGGRLVRPGEAITVPPPRAAPAPIVAETVPPPRAVSGRQRLPNYDPNTPEGRFEAIARPLRESSDDGLLHLDLNTLPKDVLPLDPNATSSSATGVIKANPGGAPHTDDLRALFEANEQKRDFYADQSDQGVPTVGPDNLEEWFALNAISSMQTNVTGQVSEAVKVMGMVRKIARDGRAAGESPAQIKADILKAVNDYGWSGPSGTNKRIGANKGYATGISETGGIKTPTFSGNYGSAESRLYDPGITNDIHNWRAANVSSEQVPAVRDGKQYMDSPHESAAANNKTLYRGLEAVFNELGAEQGVDGYAFQSAVWDGIRSMQDGAPGAWAKWQLGDFKGAIADAKAAGVFNKAIGKTGAPEPGEISRAMNQPSVKAALAEWGPYLKDPIPPELGITSVSRVYPGEMSKGKAGGPKRGAEALRPASLEFRQGERAIAESAAPVVRGLEGADIPARLGMDERGAMPWLAASHRVVEETPGQHVIHLPAGNADTARYVAAEVGSRLGLDAVPIHYPDYRSDTLAGIKYVGDAAEVARIQDALSAAGVPTIRGTTGRSLQIPLDDEASMTRIAQTLRDNGIDPASLPRYNGANERVTSGDYGRHLAETGGRFAPTTAGRRGLLERVGGAPAAGFTAPGGGLPGTRQRAEISPAFATNLAGAAAGGAAGSAATPEDATLDERLRNIGLGATAGLVGTHAVTRRFPPAAALARVPVAVESRSIPRPPRVGEDLLQARIREPAAGAAPRNLGEVHSNPHLLREAGPNDTPLTIDERLAYQDELDARYVANQTRLAALDEALRNPLRKAERPPWAGGLTNDQLVEIARTQGHSAYEPLWWERAGLETGSGEVRELLSEFGVQRGMGRREPTPAEMRAERNQLARDQRDIEAVGHQQQAAPDDARFVRPGEASAADLPFAGAQESAPSGPYATEVSGPSGNVAADLVTKNGTKPVPDQLGPKLGLSEDEAGVVGRGVAGGRLVTGRGITDPAAAREVSGRARKVMPNLDAMLGEDMPEVRAQLEQAVNDNVDLFEAYQQGRISHDSLVHDLATKVGMTKEDFLKTPVGKGFSTAETVALQAAAIDSQEAQRALARDIEARGGVDSLTPEQTAYALSSLLDAARLSAVATGARSSAGRTLNALKIRIDAAMARGVAASAERLAALRTREAAKTMTDRATQLIETAKATDAERAAVLPRDAAPTGIWQKIDDAYNNLDRYTAMTLHEKATDFDAQAAARAERAAARKAAIANREPPEALLAALNDELAAERKIFAGRKQTWEEMAFWDSKKFENDAMKRADFRGGLALEQARKSADLAAKDAEQAAERAWAAESKRQLRQSQHAATILEAIGGQEPSKQLLADFVKAINSSDDLAAAKFLKGMQQPGWWGRSQTLRLAGLLSSTATHMANAVGNVTQPLVEVPSHALTVGIDWARAKRTGGERQAYWAELGPMVEAYGSGFMAHMGEAVRVLQTGITPTDLADLSKLRGGFASGSAKLDTAVEMPLRLLGASDVLFRGGAFAMHANRLATRMAVNEGRTGAQLRGRAADIVKHLEEYPDLYQQANEAAARMVFQEKRTVPMPAAMTRGVPADIARGATAQILPFIKTPANITAQGFGLTPLGGAGVLEAIANRRNVPTERLGQQTLLAEQRAARAAVGTAILFGFMGLGAGTFTGGKSMLTAGYPQDPGEASTLPPGWREWSMRVEDGVTGNTHYVPFQNFGAAGVPMAMAALLTDSGKRQKDLVDEDELTRAVTGVGAYVLDNTFLQGLSDTVNVLHDPERYAPKFVEGLVASYGPYSAMGRQVQRAYGVAARNPREGFQGFVDAMAADYPGVSGTVPEATTALGEPRSMGVSGIGAFVAPVRSSLEADNATLRMLRENDVSLPPAPKAINLGRGQSIELSEAEQDQVKRARGAAIQQAVKDVQQSRAWQGADLTTRNALLKQAVNYGTQTANIDFYKNLSSTDLQTRAKARAVPEPYYIGGAS